MNTNMSLCGECQHGGFCNTTIPACICPTGIIGAHCQIGLQLNVCPFVETPQPLDHDYLHTASPILVNISTQTTMTMDDINVLESTAKPPSSKKPGQGVVNCATETDERVNFYTGLHSKSILQDLSKNPKNREGLTLLPVAVGVVIMYALCFTIMYLNSWKSNRVSRARQAEIDEAAQVHGPPRVSSSVGIWRGNPLRPSTFFLPFFGTPRPAHSRECVTTGLPGVSTAPAVLQGVLPPKYSHIVPCDDDSFGSYATVEVGSTTNSIPPSYDDVIREGPLGGIMMHSIPSLSLDTQDGVILGECDSRVFFTSGTGSTIGEGDSVNQQTRLLDVTNNDNLNVQPIAGNLVSFGSPLEETIPVTVGMEMGTSHNSNSLI